MQLVKHSLDFWLNQVHCFQNCPLLKAILVETVCLLNVLHKTCCRYVCLLCRCSAQWVISLYRRFYASSTFPCFLGFPSSSSLPAYLSQCHADRQQIMAGDLWRFRLRPVQIGHLWEFQPSRSHRLLREGASEGEEEKRRLKW